jgi:hypothetical protein
MHLCNLTNKLTVCRYAMFQIHWAVIWANYSQDLIKKYVLLNPSVKQVQSTVGLLYILDQKMVKQIQDWDRCKD